MRVELTGRRADISPALRQFVDRKLARIERMLNEAAVSAQVVLAEERHLRRVDVTLHARGEKFLHGAGTAPTWSRAVSLAVDKLVQQGKKVKGKWQERKRRGAPAAARLAEQAPASPDRPVLKVRRPRPVRTPRMPQIMKATRQAIATLSVADAARTLATNADGVLLFRDADTRGISALYRNADGELVLVET